MYSLLTGVVAAATDMLYSLRADPENTVITHLQGLFRWSVYLFTEQKRPVPNGYIMMHMRSAISDLSCYITMNLQHVGRECEVTGAREPDDHHLE